MNKLILLALLPIVLPSAFAFTVTSPDNTFDVGTRTTRQIDIMVNSGQDTITANFIDSKSWVTLSASQMQFGQPGVKTLSVFISPLENTLEGLYKISVLFESLSTNELKKVDLYVYIHKGEVVYMDRIAVTGSLQPLGSAKISFSIINLKSTTVQDVQLDASVRSPTAEFMSLKRTIPRIDPGQTHTEDFFVSFPNDVEDGAYSIDTSVTLQGQSSQSTQTFFVEKKPVITATEQKSSLFFGYSRTITIANIGTAEGDQTIYQSISRFDQAFFVGDAPLLVMGSDAIWTEKGVQPGEVRVISYRIDYTPMFLLIAALLLVVWLYFTKFHAIRVKKYIMQKKTINEGEEFTVAVEVHNAIGKKTDVDVIDFVPAIFSIKDASGPKAAKKKGHVGAELSWTAKGLAPGESRIFTYKIIPVFGVRGMIKLPKAGAIYKYLGRTMEMHSLPTTIGVSEVAAEDQLWKRFLDRKK